MTIHPTNVEYQIGDNDSMVTKTDLNGVRHWLHGSAF